MLHALKSMLHSVLRGGKKSASDLVADMERKIAAAEAEISVLRLQVLEVSADGERKLAELRSESAFELAQERAKSEARLSNALESLVSELAPTALQILTQEHLLKTSNAELGVEDIMLVAKSCVPILESYGLVFVGNFGETISFDPAMHENLSGEFLEPGSAVQIVCVGAAYKGKEIRRISVCPCPNAAPVCMQEESADGN